MSIGYKAPTGGWGGESPIETEYAARKRRLQERMEADKRREENLARHAAEEAAATEEAYKRGRPEVGDQVEVFEGYWKGLSGTLEEIRDGGRVARIRPPKPFRDLEEVDVPFAVVGLQSPSDAL